MKFLILQSASYLFSFSGLAVAQRRMAEGLASGGHACVVITTDLDLPDPTGEMWQSAEVLEEREDRRILRRQGVDIIVLRSYEVARSIERMVSIIDLEQRRLQADFVVVGDDVLYGKPPLLGAWLEAARKVVPPSKLVYVCHAASTLPFGPETFDKVGEGAHRKKIFEEIAGIITVSRYMGRYLQQHLGRAAEVIPFPVYGQGPFPQLGRFGEGVVGMINPSEIKGVSVFLGLARRMPEVRFGAVPSWATGSDDFEQLTSTPNVEMIMPTSNQDALFANFSVLLVPSLWQEAWGLVIVEAMLRGIPVIASDAGGVPEAKLGVDYVLPVVPIQAYTSSEDTLMPRAVLPEQDLGPWEAALRKLLTDRNEYERVSQASREAALRFVESLDINHFERYFERLRTTAS